MTRLSLALRPDSYHRLHTTMCRATVLEVAVLALLAFARPLRAQRVRGIVLDEVSHQPLPTVARARATPGAPFPPRLEDRMARTGGYRRAGSPLWRGSEPTPAESP